MLKFRGPKKGPRQLKVESRKKIEMALIRSLCLLYHSKYTLGNEFELTVYTKIDMFGFQRLKFKLFLNPLLDLKI